MKKVIYNNKLVSCEYYNKKDPFCSINGKWVDRQKVTVIPTQWTIYALILIGAYLIGLLTVMLWNL